MLKKSNIIIFIIWGSAIGYGLFSVINYVTIFEIYHLMGEVEFLKATIEVLERPSLEGNISLWISPLLQ